MDKIQPMKLPMAELATLLELQMQNGGIAMLPVTGSSMVPMLYHRLDRVWLCRLTRPPRRGDMILYRRENGQYILHRVIRAADAQTCICCGDNGWKTETVRQSDILGVVTEFTHKGNHGSVSGWRYRLYAWMWTGLMPLRKPILCLRRLLGRLKRMWKRRSAP